MIKTIKATKTYTNGIYDAEGTFPSIHATPNAGHKFIVSIKSQEWWNIGG